jgi:hypothetical protein
MAPATASGFITARPMARRPPNDVPSTTARSTPVAASRFATSSMRVRGS